MVIVTIARRRGAAAARPFLVAPPALAFDFSSRFFLVRCPVTSCIRVQFLMVGCDMCLRTLLWYHPHLPIVRRARRRLDVVDALAQQDAHAGRGRSRRQRLEGVAAHVHVLHVRRRLQRRARVRVRSWLLRRASTCRLFNARAPSKARDS